MVYAHALHRAEQSQCGKPIKKQNGLFSRDKKYFEQGTVIPRKEIAKQNTFSGMFLFPIIQTISKL